MSHPRSVWRPWLGIALLTLAVPSAGPSEAASDERSPSPTKPSQTRPTANLPATTAPHEPIAPALGEVPGRKWHGFRWSRPAAGPSASGDPEVIFTFDDGPHEIYTPRILDDFNRRGLHAAFFWVGHRVTGGRRNVSDRIAVAQRAVREGHLIGNHTINHAKLCSIPRARAAHEIDENARIYLRVTGLPLLWFRVPYGGHCSRLVDMLEERGLGHLHWDMDPREWLAERRGTSAEYLIRKLRRLEGRAVVLLHDTKRVTVSALPEVLDWIDGENRRRRARGGRPIRILDYADLAREELAPGLERVLADAGHRLLRSAAAAAAVLPAPRGGVRLEIDSQRSAP